jgi:hypothetical protein
MIKKYALLGILVITGAMALSAFVPAGDPSVPTDAIGISSDNFRKPHLWNGVYIPSMEVTSTLTAPITVFVPDKYGDGFRKAHMWNNIYIPSMDVTGLVSAPMEVSAEYLYGSGFRTPHMWNGIHIPSMDVTSN